MATRLQLWPSPPSPTRDDVHEDDQRDDDHRRHSDDGNRGRGEDHAPPRFLRARLQNLGGVK